MKKLSTILTALILFFSLSSSLAQIEYLGSTEYGRIRDITYDNSDSQTLYATTLGNHIIKSEDNGTSWDTFYSFSESNATISQFKLRADGKFSFVSENNALLTDRAVYILDPETFEIEKTYCAPIHEEATSVWVKNYAIHETNEDIVTIVQGYKIGWTNYLKVFITEDGGTNWSEVYYDQDHEARSINAIVLTNEATPKIIMGVGLGNTPLDGGIWTSTDMGENWNEVVADAVVGCISIDPHNTDHILIGTGISFGACEEAIYESFDNGDSFSVIDGITFNDKTLNCINKICFNPNNPNQIIALEENEMLLSDDNGASWESKVYDSNSPETDYYYGLNIAFNADNNDEYFISADYRSFYTTDNAETITKVLAPYFQGSFVGFNSNSSDLYYGVQSGIVHYDQESNTHTPSEVSPINYGTTNTATYWIDPYHEGRVYSFVSSFMGSNLFMSNEHGANKTSILTVQYVNIRSLGFNPNDENVIYVGLENNELQKIDFSDMGNITTEKLTLPTIEVPNAIYVAPSPQNYLFVATPTNLYYSEDNGVNWESKMNGITNDEIIFEITSNPSNPDELALATASGVYISSDKGENWNKNIIQKNVRKVAYSDQTEGLLMAASYTHTMMGAKAQILYSEDSGENWTSIPTADINEASCYSMAFDFKSDKVDVYMAFGDLGPAKYEFTIPVGPILTFSADAVGFEDTQVGSSSEANFTITNTGDKDLVLTSVNIEAPFSLNEMPGTIAPGGSTELTLTFEPVEEGDFNKTLSFVGNHSNSGELLAVMGKATPAPVGPLLNFSENAIAFDDTQIGSTSEKTVTISNIGDQTLFIASAAIEAPFSIAEMPGSIAPGADTEITIVFTPTSAGDFAESLTFSGSHVNQDKALDMTGKGLVGAVLSFSEESISFEDTQIGSTAEETVSITNTGDQTLFIASAAIEAPFSIAEMPGSIAPGANTVITIVFTPTAEGDFSESVTFSGSHTNQDEALDISGKGIPVPVGPILAFSEESIAFEDTKVNETAEIKVSISNTGDQTLFIASAALEAPFSIAEMPGSIAPGANTEITIIFAPTSEGDFTESLTFSGSHTNQDEALAISGKGIKDVGLNENNVDGLNFFPNPTTDFINISAKNNIKSISIINANGMTVKHINLNGSSLQISLTDLNKGVYFIKVEQSNSEFYIQKVIKE